MDGDGNGHGASPVNSYFLTSPDLVTWTTVQTFAYTMAVGLAANLSAWIIVAGTSGGTRILYSVNVSTGILQTWKFADYMDHASVFSLATSGYPGRIVLGNGQQFMTAVLDGALLTPAVGMAAVSQATLTGI